MLKEKILKDLKLTHQFKLKPSKINKAGVGVFSLTEIKKDTVILNNKYKNDIHISWNSVSFLDNNVLNHIKSMCHTDKDGFYIDDLVSNLNCSYYVNHSEMPNAHYDPISDCFYAIRDIKVDEEITCYYLPNERDWSINEKE